MRWVLRPQPPKTQQQKKKKGDTMATAHLSVKTGAVGKGTPHAEYISRTGKYEKKLEQGEKLESTESGNMPAWAENNPLAFWRAADLYERKNGTVYREHEIALPRELSKEHRIELVREWVQKELGDRHAYTWAIHNKTALDGKEQPHVHLMFSERINDGIERDPEQYFKRYNPKFPERGGAKKHRTGETPTERKAALVELRDRWEQMHNANVRRNGIGISKLDARSKISMKSYKERAETDYKFSDKQPQRKMLPSESNALHRVAELQRAAAETLTHYDQERVNKYFETIHKPTAQRIQQEEKERAEQEREAIQRAERYAAKQEEKERSAARYIAYWIREEDYYERDKGVLDIKGGDEEYSRKLWLVAKAAGIETSQRFDEFVSDRWRNKEQQLQAALAKGAAPEIQAAFQQRAERERQAIEAEQKKQEQIRQQREQEIAKIQAAKPKEQQKTSEQPKPKQGRGIRH